MLGVPTCYTVPENQEGHQGDKDDKNEVNALIVSFR